MLKNVFPNCGGGFLPAPGGDLGFAGFILGRRCVGFLLFERSFPLIVGLANSTLRMNSGRRVT